jgi:cyclophilin family peptidyl-prolyl cis-trans isomerase
VLRLLKTLAFAGALLVSRGAFAADPAMPHVAFLTNMGAIVVELDRVKAPLSVANFLSYVKDKTYEDTVFYRVVPGFVIQAGTYGADGSGRVTRPGIPLEANNGLKNIRGALSMARNEDPNTAQAEFFIVLRDTPGLDPAPGDTENKTGYAVFGHVVEGMDIVDNISRVTLGGSGPFGAAAPLKPVIINRALLLPPTTPR